MLAKCPPLKIIFKIKTRIAKRETKNPAFLNLSHIVNYSIQYSSSILNDS